MQWQKITFTNRGIQSKGSEILGTRLLLFLGPTQPTTHPLGEGVTLKELSLGPNYSRIIKTQIVYEFSGLPFSSEMQWEISAPGACKKNQIGFQFPNIRTDHIPKVGAGGSWEKTMTNIN